MIQNTKEFQNFIVNNELSDQDKIAIEKTIKAFSEYISALNPDYVYNKTYLSAFVQDFVLCQKALKQKYKILCDEIKYNLSLENALEKCVVRVDEAWVCKNGNISLNNSINSQLVKSNKMKIEIEYVHENGFVVTEQINLEGNYKEKLNECISRYINQRKEILTDAL